MEVSVTEFKAKCLSLLNQVSRTGMTLTITKRGQQIAEVRRKSATDSSLRDRLKGSVAQYDDPFEPSVADSEIDTGR